MLASALLLAATLLLGNQPVGTQAAFTSAQKTELVNIHNRLREAAWPTPTKMNFLTWNTRLEGLAQSAAVACTGDHNYGGDYAPLGENIYTGFRTNATEIVLAWHIEKAAYNYSAASCNTSTPGLSACGHYLQVMTDGVLEIGCGHNLCSGSNMVYCEYSSGQGGLPYTSSSPEFACSKCPTYRGRCLNGLCVNSSIVGMADVQGFDSTATVAGTACKVNCSNCGVSTSIPGVDCFCSCSSSSGAFCDTKAPTWQLTCSQCALLNTRCLNGGVDQNGTNCSCKCPDDYVGKQCQLYRPYYLNAMRVSIGTQFFCAFSNCLRVPVTRSVFKRSIWSGLRTAVAAAVNSFCNANQANFALCCSNTAQKPSSVKTLVAESDIGYVDNADMATDDSGLLYVSVYANLTAANNQLCPSSRRKRATSSQPMLAQAALQSVLQQSNSTISDSLSSCCSSTILSSVTYQSYASGTYGIADSGNSTGNAGGPASRLGVGLDCLPWMSLPLVWLTAWAAV